MLNYTVLYYIILYYTILYYAQVGPGGRPIQPSGRQTWLGLGSGWLTRCK